MKLEGWVKQQRFPLVKRFEGNLEVGGLGRSFKDHFVWEVGNGQSIKFWEDKWVDNEALKRKFPRLFRLVFLKKLCWIIVGVNNGWKWNLVWRRSLFVWEKNQVDQLLEVLQECVLDSDKVNKWTWKDVASFRLSQLMLS